MPITSRLAQWEIKSKLKQPSPPSNLFYILLPSSAGERGMGLQSVLSTSSPLILHSHFPAPLWDPWAGGTAWNRGTACSPFSLPLPLPFIFSFPPFFFAFFLLFIFLSPFLFPFFLFFPFSYPFPFYFSFSFPFFPLKAKRKNQPGCFAYFVQEKEMLIHCCMKDFYN